MMSAGPDMVEDSELLWHATSISGGHIGRTFGTKDLLFIYLFIKIKNLINSVSKKFILKQVTFDFLAK